MLDDRLPSLVSIRAFEAAARHGSFAAAARELRTTAASVSYHVRQLEREIAAQLFVRHPQRVSLTPSGQVVADEAAKAFAGLRASFVRAADADDRRLTITTLPSVGTSWLTPRLGNFRAANPDIRVELDLSEPVRDLGNNGFDVAIRNGRGEWPGLRAQFLIPSIFLPLCAPHLRDAAIDLGSTDATVDVPLLGRPDWWAKWYRVCGCPAVPPPEAFGTGLAYEYLDIAAAVAGQGIAIGSPIVFHDELASGRLVPAHDVVADSGLAFWLTYPAAHRPTRKVARFAEWITEVARGACDRARPYIERARLPS